MLLAAFAAQAQQAIFERHDTRSPQFNEDGTVTLRDRDSMEQTRVKIEDLPAIISGKVSMSNLLRGL